MRLKYQIYITLVVFSIVLILLNAAINSWSFDRDFSNYVIANEKQRLSVTVDNLENAYMDHGSWNWLKSQPSLFRELTQLTGPPRPQQNLIRDNSRPERQDVEDRPNRNRLQNAEDRPNRNRLQNAEDRPNASQPLNVSQPPNANQRRNAEDRPNANQRPNAEARPNANRRSNAEDRPNANLRPNAEGRLNVNQRPNAEERPNANRRPNAARNTRNTVSGRLVLMDAEKQFLIGQQRPAINLITIPIVVDEKNVGYLGFREPRGVPGDLADVFSGQQLRHTAYVAAAMVLLSALLAIALASGIVSPILSVKKAVQTISGGDYTHQIESERTDEIGDLENNIDRLSLTLMQNKIARQQWMAEISHELRTPVAVLQGELEGMQDGVVPINREAVDSLHAESVRMGLLINDLYDLSMSDVGALNYQMQAVNLGDVLEHRLQFSKALTTQASLHISVHLPDEPVQVTGDTQRLSQLIDNLLQNSVRYTDPGGKVVIRLKLDEEECILDWSDSAPGVSDEQLPKLFDALYRTEDSRSRETGGSGLGLAIVRKIIDAHGGTVKTYHSNMNGLGIQIRFPLTFRNL